MQGRIKYIQIFGDALIPLLGFFLWDWSLYFILIYYILDVLMGEITMYFKARKVRENNHPKDKWYRYAVFSGSLFVLGVILIHFAMFLIQPDIDFLKELIAFWTYEELGIQQGYILVPLLAIVAIQKYRMEFLVTGRYRMIEQEQMWNRHFRQYFLIIAGCGITIGTSFLFRLEEVWYLLTIVVISSLYDYYFTD